MSHYLFTICATFQLRERGLVISSDIAIKDAAAKGIRLRVGETVQLRCSNRTAMTTQIKGIEFIHPFNPDNTLSFLLPPEIAEKNISVGTEVWSV
jgi:hypothetical protein